MCLAGHVGGLATQSGSTRIPIPASVVVAAAGSTYLADATHLPGRQRWKRRPRRNGRDRQIPRNLQKDLRDRSGVTTSSEHQVVWR